MRPGLRFTKLWQDEDMVELRTEVCDGDAFFSNQIYVGHQQLAITVLGLNTFKDQVHGGQFELRFGRFGPEFGSGALEVRLQFRKLGHILVQVSAQSEFHRVGDENLASEMRLHFASEPAVLDNLIVGLRAMSNGHCDQAEL